MIIYFNTVAMLWAQLLILSTSKNQTSSQIKYQHGQGSPKQRAPKSCIYNIAAKRTKY